MCNAMDIIKRVISLLLCITLLITCINILRSRFAEIEAQDHAYAGEVVDKKIINAHSGLFATDNIDYRLVIQVDYEYKSKTKTTRKSISVDKETYLQADISDWFDSHTLVVTKAEKTP